MESSLYLPVKRFLEKLGFEVKGEVCGCDLVALADGESMALVICELKLTFNLELVLQAADRSSICDELWLAVSASPRGRGREHDPRARKLCRLLGVGLLSVSARGKVEVLVEPVPWRPRRDTKRRSRIVDEHRRRQGDPALGGSTRQPIMTAYRQRALACAAALSRAPARPRDLKVELPDAPKILLRSVYGWFVRIDRGLYALTDPAERHCYAGRITYPLDRQRHLVAVYTAPTPDAAHCPLAFCLRVFQICGGEMPSRGRLDETVKLRVLRLWFNQIIGRPTRCLSI